MVTNYPLFLALKGYVVWGKQIRGFVVKKYYKKPQEQSNVYPCGFCNRLIFRGVLFLSGKCEYRQYMHKKRKKYLFYCQKIAIFAFDMQLSEIESSPHSKF